MAVVGIAVFNHTSHPNTWGARAEDPHTIGQPGQLCLLALIVRSTQSKITWKESQEERSRLFCL